MLELDHLTVISPSLKAGVDYVRDCLGIDLPYGGTHPEMGTHNHLLRLGDDAFLEVIAVDPRAPVPPGPRWFGFGDPGAIRAAWNQGQRLRGWVARTADLDLVLAAHAALLGRKTRVSRGDRSWHFSVRDDGMLPAGGAAPCVITWGERGCPAVAMPDLGARLVGLTIEHPDPAWLRDLYRQLDIENPPEVHQGAGIRLRATIATPSGIRELG